MDCILLKWAAQLECGLTRIPPHTRIGNVKMVCLCVSYWVNGLFYIQL